MTLERYLKHHGRYKFTAAFLLLLLFGGVNATTPIIERIRVDQDSRWISAFATGLVVIGAATEHVLRIFDITSGEELWSHRLPTSANATPMSYEIDGVQYIAVVVGGHEGLGMESGDSLMVFKINNL